MSLQPREKPCSVSKAAWLGYKGPFLLSHPRFLVALCATVETKSTVQTHAAAATRWPAKLQDRTLTSLCCSFVPLVDENVYPMILAYPTAEAASSFSLAPTLPLSVATTRRCYQPTSLVIHTATTAHPEFPLLIRCLSVHP